MKKFIPNSLKQLKYLLFIVAMFCSLNCLAQKDTALLKTSTDDEPISAVKDSSRQRDMIDFVFKILKIDTSSKNRLKAQKLNFSAVPAVGYSLSTGFAVDITGNVAFYTGAAHKENLSAIDAEIIFDTKGQKIFTSRSEVWFDNNNYKLTTDLRLERYPIDTYGLGTLTTVATDDPIDYSYMRIYGTFFKKLIPDFYLGAGYYYDYHFNVSQQGNVNGTVSDFTKYGFSKQSTSSGPVLNLLFDNRRNPINPLAGGYASILFRDNYTFLGSDNNWQELQFDFRKYIRLAPTVNNNVLAFWSIIEFTKGDVPYLDLPYTGSDTYNNFGRGYAEQRFRGKDLLYIEGEYRFGISRNGLIGGVVFTNAESFSQYPSNNFVKFAPAVGTGLRLKINKHSDTNVCIDYAYGIYGSHGLFVNLGENF